MSSKSGFRQLLDFGAVFVIVVELLRHLIKNGTSIKMYVLLTILIIAIAAILMFESTEQTTQINEGILTNRSVLLYSAPINGASFEWKGENVISRLELEISTIKGNNQLEISGGLTNDFVQVAWSASGAQLDGFARLYSEPNDILLGKRDDSTELVHTERCTGHTPFQYIHEGNRIITALELLDQTNGTGVVLDRYRGLDRRTMGVWLKSFSPGARVDCIVNVYSAARRAKNHQIGEMQADSVHLTTQRVTNVDLDRVGLYNFIVDRDNADHQYHVDFVRFTDMTDGYGGHIRHAEIENTILLWSMFDNPNGMDVDYEVEFFGRSMPRASKVSEISVGAPQNNERIAVVRGVNEHGENSTRIELYTGYPITRFEVRNVDSSEHVRTRLITRDDPIHVVFDVDDVKERIHFILIAYAQRSWDPVKRESVY